ncbi:MAG: terminase family protein [Planctomycetota bacterium]
MTPIRLSKAALFERVGYRPHAGQRLVHRSKAKRRVLATGSRWGKSRCAAMEAVAAALEPRKRSMGWCVAPTLELADKVFREIVIIAAEHLTHRLVELKQHDKKLVLRNLGGGLSEIRGKTADNPVSLLGEGLDWLIVDECSRLKPEIWSSFLSQRLIDKDGWALLISTPKGKGWFYEMWRRGQGRDPQYESWNAPSWQNPYLRKELIAAERERLPERVFAQELGGQFIEGAGSVFRYVREAATGGAATHNPELLYYAGLDLARVQDFTVLVILDEKKRVVFVDRFTKMDWQNQVKRMRAGLLSFDDPPVLVDSTGAGEPIFEQLVRAGCSAKPYPFTARSKVALVDNLALMLEKRELTLPRAELCPELLDELESFEYRISDQGHWKTGAVGGAHDDLVMALALAAWQVADANRPYWCENTLFDGELVADSRRA